MLTRENISSFVIYEFEASKKCQVYLVVKYNMQFNKRQ